MQWFTAKIVQRRSEEGLCVCGRSNFSWDAVKRNEVSSKWRTLLDSLSGTSQSKQKPMSWRNGRHHAITSKGVQMTSIPTDCCSAIGDGGDSRSAAPREISESAMPWESPQKDVIVKFPRYLNSNRSNRHVVIGFLNNGMIGEFSMALYQCFIMKAPVKHEFN